MKPITAGILGAFAGAAAMFVVKPHVPAMDDVFGTYDFTKTAVRAQLRNPASAEFRNMRRNETGRGVCGEVRTVLANGSWSPWMRFYDGTIYDAPGFPAHQARTYAGFCGE